MFLFTSSRYTWGAEVWLHSFLTSSTSEGAWQTSRPGRLIPSKERQSPLNSRLGGSQSRSGRDSEEKSLFPYRESNPGPSPARSVQACCDSDTHTHTHTYTHTHTHTGIWPYKQRWEAQSFPDTRIIHDRNGSCLWAWNLVCSTEEVK